MIEDTGTPVVKSPSVLANVEDEALHLIDLALQEDVGAGDWTSRWTVPSQARVRAHVLARSDGIVAGLTPSIAVFMRLDGRIESYRLATDGQHVHAGDVLYELSGPARPILTGERVALNFLQHLSGIATLTRRYVDALVGTHTSILDTRKTTPGWRALEKEAVRAGGGVNHRRGLFDAVLVKDNHIAIAGGVREALEAAKDHNTSMPVIVEVRDLDEVDTALRFGADRMLLDNMDLETMREAVRRARLRRPPVPTEASGNITLERVRAVAETGVDFISVGAITHSAPALDVSLEVIGT